MPSTPEVEAATVGHADPAHARTDTPSPRASTSAAGLAKSAGLISVATMMSRILGLVRDQVLAHRFGSGDAMDAFNVAFRIPNLLRDLFAEGAMSAAFVPTFTRALTSNGREAAWRLANVVISTLAVATGIIVVAGVLFAGPLTTLLAWAYGDVPGKLELAVRLTRVMFPFLTLIAIAVAMMGMLNSLGRFFVPALSPATFNVATIAAVFLLVPIMPLAGLDPIVGVAIGTLAGGVGQVALQWPQLRREGYRFRFVLSPRDPGLREILALMGPGTLGLAAVQINLFVSTILATSQGTGALSWLNYAFRIMYLPIGLFGVSIASAAIPSLSTHAARSDLRALRDTVSKSLRMMLMLNVPATLGLMALATPIVGLIFERGAFTSADTGAVAGALMCYAPGLVGYSAVKVASPTFYALKDSRTPVAVSVSSVVLNLAMSIVLVRYLGYRGLALGTAFAALANAVILLALLSRRIGGLDGRRIALALFKIGTASMAMAACAWGTERALGMVWPGPAFPMRALRVAGGVAVGIGSLIVWSHLLRIDEFGQAISRVTSRVFGRSRA
ncbi:MAG: murein biosynthesis integral membrane protein MurJ [Vicinamibacterales bacterium]